MWCLFILFIKIYCWLNHLLTFLLHYFVFLSCLLSICSFFLTLPEPERFAPVLMEDTYFRRRVEVKAGETVKLACNFNAYPPAEVQWYKRKRGKDGKMVKESECSWTFFQCLSNSKAALRRTNFGGDRNEEI